VRYNLFLQSLWHANLFHRIAEIVAKMSDSRSKSSATESSGKKAQSEDELAAKVQAMVAECLANRVQHSDVT